MLSEYQRDILNELVVQYQKTGTSRFGLTNLAKLFEHFPGYLSSEMADAFDFLETQGLIKIRRGNSEFLNILLLDLTIAGKKYFEQEELQFQKEAEKQQNEIRLRKREQKVRWIQWLIPLLISIAALVNSILARLGR